MKQVVVTVFCLLMIGPASAAWYDGNQLKQAYEDGNTGSVYGYIFGVLDNDRKTFLYRVIPDGVKGGQLYEIVRRYLYQNPHKLHENAADLVEAAIYTAFAPRQVAKCQAAMKVNWTAQETDPEYREGPKGEVLHPFSAATREAASAAITLCKDVPLAAWKQ